MAAYVEMDQVTKTYQMGEVTIKAADGISFQVEKGEFVVVVGPSGAGKTTVLNILGGMDTLSKGTVRMDGRDISHFNRTQLENYRRYDIGFVFQFYNLIPNLTALENVEIAAQLCTDAIPAEDVLRAVGLHDRMHNFPAQLSGGEQQRVAIARAIVNNPSVIIADEPTGNLDSVTGAKVEELLFGYNKNKGVTLIIVTHDAELAAKCDMIVNIKDGKIESVEQKKAQPTARKVVR